jgi:hypothetical protein
MSMSKAKSRGTKPSRLGRILPLYAIAPIYGKASDLPPQQRVLVVALANTFERPTSVKARVILEISMKAFLPSHGKAIRVECENLKWHLNTVLDPLRNDHR